MSCVLLSWPLQQDTDEDTMLCSEEANRHRHLTNCHLAVRRDLRAAAFGGNASHLQGAWPCVPGIGRSRASLLVGVLFSMVWFMHMQLTTVGFNIQNNSFLLVQYRNCFESWTNVWNTSLILPQSCGYAYSIIFFMTWKWATSDTFLFKNWARSFSRWTFKIRNFTLECQGCV